MLSRWSPPREVVESSNVYRFMSEHGFESYRGLVEDSLRGLEWWGRCEEALGVEWFREYSGVVDLSRGVEWAGWFTGGSLNLVHNILDRHVKRGLGARPALEWLGEDGSVRTLTYGELEGEVNRLGNLMRGMGVGRGGVVASLLPMLPETIATMLAAMKIGAVYMPIFSGFGPRPIAERLRDASPSLIVTCDGYYRRGVLTRLREVLGEACREAGVEAPVIVVRRAGLEDQVWEGDHEYSASIRRESSGLEAEWMAPDEPALLLYTSGTTGRPKGAVISHAGALIQPAKEHFFNLDVKPSDVFMWITDIGWMMGPWQVVGSQFHGARHVIMEGAFDYPGPERLWGIIEELGVTHLGYSATVIRMLRSYGEEALEGFELPALRVMGNTGEPIDPETWSWAMEKVGRMRCPLINLSGGTEIFGCLLSPSPVVELKPSTLWGPGLGMDIDVLDDEGRGVRGGIGYLVCRKPAPSMTRGFWGDPERYIETYWRRFPGVWYHGDLASIDEEGYWYLHGRADDVLKVAGRRVGPAEIEEVVNSHPEVAESAVVGLPHSLKGEAIGVFAKPRSWPPRRGIEEEVQRLVTARLGRPYRPGLVLLVRDLPRTRSGKIMRRLIKGIIGGAGLGDASTLENPDSVKEIERAWLLLGRGGALAEERGGSDECEDRSDHPE